MKKLGLIVVVMVCAVGVMAGPHHRHGGGGRHHHHHCGYYYGGYRNDGLALAAGICNIVGGVISNARPTYIATPAYAAPVYTTPVYTTPTVVTPTPTVYYHNSRPVGSVSTVTENRTQTVHYNTYHIEQTVSSGGKGIIIIGR